MWGKKIYSIHESGVSAQNSDVFRHGSVMYVTCVSRLLHTTGDKCVSRALHMSEACMKTSEPYVRTTETRNHILFVYLNNHNLKSNNANL